MKSKTWLKKAPIFVILFALIGAITFLISAATPKDNAIEPEDGTLTSCATSIDSTSASGGKAVNFNCPTQPPTTGKVFVHPGVVYTKAEVDKWSTSSPEYTRLANACAGQLNPSGSCLTARTPVVFGTTIDSGSDPKDTNNEINKGLKDQSGYAKAQAILWAADNNATRKAAVTAYLDQYRTVTGYGGDTVQQWRLNSGWACTNLAQAAEIINYQDTQFKRYMKDVCYPNLDWGTGANWHASFADSKLAIAAYLGDEELWTDAKNYFYIRLKQSVYLTSDGNKITPMRNEDRPNGTTVRPRIFIGTGTPHASSTLSHWGATWGPAQINSDFTFNTAVAPIVNGTNAERMRDLSHVTMSYTAWVSAARTIRAQGEQVSSDAYQRILAGWGYHASRTLAFAQTGTTPAPVTYNGDGGPIRLMGFFPAKKFFGADTPAAINSMLQRSDVTGFAAGGTLHMVGEAYTDNQ